MTPSEKIKIYENIHLQWSGLVDTNAPWYSNLSNAAALLMQELNPWWVGFYLVKENHLYLGPFQGPTACTRIAKGKGVCGTCWEKRETQLVPNVHEFPGHIACSSLSESEIVVPCFNRNNEIWAVLDIDSKLFNDFDLIDKQELEKFCASLEQIDHDRN